MKKGFGGIGCALIVGAIIIALAVVGGAGGAAILGGIISGAMVIGLIVIAVIIGLIFWSVSLHKKDENVKRADRILNKELEEFDKGGVESLAKKYEDIEN